MGLTVDQRECTIELEGSKGKLRIHWKGVTAVETWRLDSDRDADTDSGCG
jgi:hypothetical protein